MIAFLPALVLAWAVLVLVPAGLPLVAAPNRAGRRPALALLASRVYGASTFAAITTLTLPVTVDNMRMVPGDDRLYVVVGGQLFVIQTR